MQLFECHRLLVSKIRYASLCNLENRYTQSDNHKLSTTGDFGRVNRAGLYPRYSQVYDSLGREGQVHPKDSNINGNIYVKHKSC